MSLGNADKILLFVRFPDLVMSTKIALFARIQCSVFYVFAKLRLANTKTTIFMVKASRLSLG